MNAWLSKITGYLNKFLEVGVVLLAVSIVAVVVASKASILDKVVVPEESESIS